MRQEVYLDWPPKIEQEQQPDTAIDNCTDLINSDNMESSETSLSDLYKQALEAMQQAESKPRGDVRQTLYLKARAEFEKAMALVETLGLFSDNETIDDVATSDLKYLLIPAFLAKITISSECGPNRLETFTRASLLIKRFFERILRYGLGDSNISAAVQSKDATMQNPSSSSMNLEAAMHSRSEKIERYKKRKILDDRIDELESRMASNEQVDDEVAREFYLKLITKWIDETYESLEREVKPALYFEQNRGTDVLETDVSTISKQSSSSVRPQTITLVKDELQKQVFGLGYPSRPTVTVDEFIGKKIDSGELAFQKHKEVYANSLQRYAEKPNLLREQEEQSDEEREAKEERDDEEELQRRRKWDEFTDENPRGSGNRHNMG